MATSHEDIISALDELVATCRDGEEGLRAAAEAAQNAELRGLFLTYAQQRGDFRAELEEEIRRLGGTPSTRGSIAGSHRGWMSVRSAVGGGSDDSVVAEAKRGEDAAKRAYQAALDREPPPPIRAIVERQSARIREAQDRVRSLRERAA